MTLSFSLLHVHWILPLNKNISFMVFIKQLKLRIFMQCKCCYRTGSLPCKLRVMGSIPCLGLDVFFFLSFPPLSLSGKCSPYTDCMFTQVYARLWQGPVYLSGGPSSTIDFGHRHSSGCILCLWQYS